MKILLTGHTGYIGSVMLPYLQQAGHIVVGYDTGYYASGHLYDLFTAPIKEITKDIRKIEEHDLEGCDAVIHLAELSNDPIGQHNPEITYDVNHEGTKRLIEKSKKAGVRRFIYSSSCSVYGASDQMSDETSATNPLTAYAKSKVMNEEYLNTQTDASFMTTIMRNATVYGPSPRMRFDLAVNNLAGLAWTTKKITMDSDGTPWRPFIHVQDVCGAFLEVLRAPATSISGEIFNIGDTRSNYQIKEISQIIGEVFGITDISLNATGADKRNYRVNFDKLMTRIPTFSCKKDVRAGAQDLKDIFTQISLTEEIFLSKEYTRLKMLKHLKESGALTEDLYWRHLGGGV